MRRFALSLGFVATAAALIALPTAIAASPNVSHFEFDNTSTSSRFCGTGATITTHAAGHGTQFLDGRVQLVGKVVYSNPLNDNAVIAHTARIAESNVVAGDPTTGDWVSESTNRGLQLQARLAHGSVIFADVGFLSVRNTFIAFELVTSEVIHVGGQQESEGDDSALFCEVVVEALGVG